MSEKLFLNLTLSPYCFDFNYLQQDSFSKPAKLRETLQIIKEKSLWVQDKNKTKYLVYSILQNYQNQSFKKDIEEFLEIVSNKIINCYDGDFVCENSWERTIPTPLKDYLHHIIKQENLLTETIDRDSRGIPIEEQNEEIVKQFLQPIIPYSKIIKIYDPYFSFYRRDGNNPNKNEKFLEIIINLLNIISCNLSKPRIEIYTCSCNNTQNDFFRNRIRYNLNLWKRSFAGIYNEHNIEIVAYIFEKKFHDRYLITNFCGLHIGRGADINENSDSTWTLLRDDKIEDKVRQFDIHGNNPNNRLLYKITKNDIEEF